MCLGLVLIIKVLYFLAQLTKLQGLQLSTLLYSQKIQWHVYTKVHNPELSSKQTFSTRSLVIPGSRSISQRAAPPIIVLRKLLGLPRLVQDSSKQLRNAAYGIRPKNNGLQESTSFFWHLLQQLSGCIIGFYSHHWGRKFGSFWGDLLIGLLTIRVFCGHDWIWSQYLNRQTSTYNMNRKLLSHCITRIIENWAWDVKVKDENIIHRPQIIVQYFW